VDREMEVCFLLFAALIEHCTNISSSNL
jgi:hypothetical protein